LQLEAVGEVRRIDPSVVPTAYHCAVVSDGEFEQLRRVENIVRLGRVTTLERGNIVLEQGATAVDDDDQEKNRLCTPIVPPTVARHWVELMEVELTNRQVWSADPELSSWLMNARLDGFNKTIGERIGVDAEATAHLGRYVENLASAREGIARLRGAF
jgi:hypothetical protein